MNSTPDVIISENADVLDLLLTRLSSDRTAEAALSLMDHLELLALLVEGLDEFLRRGDTIAQSLSDGFTEIKRLTPSIGAKPSPDLSAMAANLKQLVFSLAEASSEISDLLDSKLLSSEIISLLSTTGEAAVEARQVVSTTPVRVTGTLSMLRSLKDPDVQAGVSFFLEMAKSMGKRVR